MTKAKTEPPRRFGRDTKDAITVGEIIDQLAPFAEKGDGPSFARKLDELFLDGAWGDEWQYVRGARYLRADIRGLIYAALRRGAERQ